MTDLRRISEIFASVLELLPEARTRALAEACGEDHSLRREIEVLLAHNDRSSGFLETPPILDMPEVQENFTLPSRLGRYVLLERLGEGGMAVVYLAQQDHPRRRVAIKVLKAGVADEVMLRRFEYEAELLGRLRHPGIAQIYEAVTAQTTAGTLPYFAMEVVEGAPLTDHAHSAGLDQRARINLMIEVCEAIHHAHQKGIVHRDLKPANVLVNESGRPKVLDFGVARLTDADLHMTRPGELLGTLAYMSPEQAAGAADDLDTRSDVYALGVILYELLVERLPLALEQLELHEAVRVIREVEPPRLGSLRRELCGDLETIVAMALAKEKEHRYPSASELAQDLRRYLRDEPIMARPPSTLYQLRKFARRHTVLAASAGIITILVTLSAIVNGRLATELAERRDEALAATEVAQQETQRAVRAAAVSKGIAGFLEDMLASAEPYVAPKDTTVAQALEWAVQRVDERFAAQPSVAAAVHSRLASIHFSRGELDASLIEARAALFLRNQLDEGEYVGLATSLATLGTVLAEKGEVAEAIEFLRQAIGLFAEHVSDDDPRVLTALTSLGAALYTQGMLAEAEPLMQRALELRRETHGSEHPYTLTALNNFANLLRKKGDLAQAEPMIRENVDISRRVLSTAHPNTITAIYNYADLLRELGQVDDAETLFREAIALGSEHLPTGHWLLGLYRSRFGELLLDANRLPEAADHLSNGHRLLAQMLGTDHARTKRAAAALKKLEDAQ